MEKAGTARAWGSPKRQEDGIFSERSVHSVIRSASPQNSPVASTALCVESQTLDLPELSPLVPLLSPLPRAPASSFHLECLLTVPSAWDSLPQAVASSGHLLITNFL